MKKLCTVLLLLCLLLTGCQAKMPERYLIIGTEAPTDYDKTVLSFLSNYKAREPEDMIYAELSRGNAVACFDVQALPAMAKGVGRYWYPNCRATVVIAVDRSQTDAAVTGWNSLIATGESVGTAGSSVIRNMLLFGAISYGLHGKAPIKQDALELFKTLYQSDRLQLGDQNMPIVICLDYEAAAWKRDGRNIEIIVPKEGTLSYTLGLLSDVPLALEPGLDDALLSAGLPLSEGRRPDVYPPDYLSAVTLSDEDFDWFLSVTKDVTRDLRRTVFHTHLYSTADFREHILLALLVAAAALLWRGTVSHRIVHRDIRRTAGLMSWLMVGWILLRMFKWQLLSTDLICRMCWYGYYIFQLGLPVTLLYLAVIVDRPEGGKHLLRPVWPPLVCYILSVLLVLTNDLHQLVFRFDPGGNWSNDYSYGPGYWAVASISVLFLLVSIGILLRKGRRSSYWGGKVFPLLFCGGMLCYAVAYIKRVPLVWESDFTINICILAALFFEILLHTGLIPVNIRYHRLFAAAPIGLNLLDQSGMSVLSSSKAPSISHSIWKRLCADMDHPLLRDNDTLLHAVPIHGGMAVWREELSQINGLRQEIQNAKVRLEAANALLREESEVKKRLLATETNRVLFRQLDRDMERRISDLSELIRALPEAADRRRHMAYITICLCHIKRRCNLFFLARQGEPILCDELSIYLDELAELAGYAGIRMLIRCGVHGPMDIRNAALCYDFCFEALSLALKKNASPVLGYLEREKDALVFRLLPGGVPEDWEFSEELRSAVSEMGGRISCKDLDDAVGIRLTIPWGGEAHG